MAEVTRVPLQPIAKGSLTKLWLGVVIAVLIGAGLAWAAVPRGVEVDTIVAGSGPAPSSEDVVFVKYVGRTPDGEEFDRSQEIPLPVQGIFPEGNPLPLDGMIPGFVEGITQMQKGGKYELFIPADKAYGDSPPPQSGIAPGSDLTFEIELVDFMSQEDFQRRIGILQQTLQQQGMAGPGPSGAEGAPQPVPQN